MMLLQDFCGNDDSKVGNDDLELIVRKVFNNVQDVSRVDVVGNALKHVRLEQCMKQLEVQYGIDKLKLFLLESTDGNLSRPVRNRGTLLRTGREENRKVAPSNGGKKPRVRGLDMLQAGESLMDEVDPEWRGWSSERKSPCGA